MKRVAAWFKTLWSELSDTVRDIAAVFNGYKPNSKQKNTIIRLAVSAVLFIIGLFFGKVFAASLIIYLLSYCICAYDVIIDAGKRLVRKNFFDETALMSIASIGAFAIGEFAEGAAVMILYQLGELFQSIAVNRSRRSISSMMELRPDVAHKYVDGNVVDVSTDELVCGDICVVRPGERVPIDGVIVDGVLEADASAITGESLPVTLKEGSRVISGYISLSSVVRIKATSDDADSTVTRILRIVEEQSENKAQSEKLVTKFARYYTPAIFALTLIIGVIVPIFAGDFKEWIYRGLSLLVISCPCAMVISVPLTYFGGIGGASLKGILIKGGSVLDALCMCDTVVLDKTGTLTSGKLSISGVCPVDGVSEDAFKSAASISEGGSNHPIARSIIEYVGESNIKCEDFREYAGRGTAAFAAGHMFFAGTVEFLGELGIEISDLGDGGARRVHFAIDKTYIGYIELTDTLKESAPDAIASLRGAGFDKIGMLSGDKTVIANKVSDTLGLDICVAELKPTEKLDAVSEIMESSAGVIFAGDGINDAPTLAHATVGVAMGDVGSDVALEASDVVIMDGRLEKIADAVNIARRTVKIVKQNIVFILAVKLLVLVLTLFGVGSMTGAIFADVGVAVLAVLNSMRTLKRNK